MAVPNPEELYDPTVLTPDEASEVEEISQRKPVGVLSVGLALAAAFLVYRSVVQRRLEKTTAPTPELMERALVVALQESFSGFVPNWVKMVSPLMYAGYLTGVQEAGITVPQEVLQQMSTGYAESLGNYIHKTSSQAMLNGFRALVNRKVDHRRALLQTSGAFGVGLRAMNALVNVWSAEEPKAYTNVKRISSAKEQRAKLIIAKGIKDRAKAVGDHESWNAKEQGKQAAWLYALRSGVISGAANKVWHTAKDERVCPSCGPLDGKKIPVGAKFETDQGKTLTPPLHVSCRCEVQLKASLKRILLGTLRKQPVKKAYEGHPWARYQTRSAAGQWVKGAGGHKLALAPAEAEVQPKQAEPKREEKVEVQAPEQPKVSYDDLRMPKISYDDFRQPKISYEQRPMPKISYGDLQETKVVQAETPLPKISSEEIRKPETAADRPMPKISYDDFRKPAFPMSEEEMDAEVEHEEMLQDEKALHEYLRNKEETTPGRGQKGHPLTDMFKDRDLRQEKEVVDDQEPDYYEFAWDNELYGIVPNRSVFVDEMVDLDKTRMVHDLGELDEMVNQEIKNGIRSYTNAIYADPKSYERGMQDRILAYSGERENYYIEQDSLEQVFDWMRAKNKYEQEKEYNPDLPPPEFNEKETVAVWNNFDTRPHQMLASDVASRMTIKGQHLVGILHDLTPTVVVTGKVDLNQSQEDLGMHSGDDPAWEVSGRHYVSRDDFMDSVIHPTTNRVISHDVLYVDPE